MEANIDSLTGMTHFYGGLAEGNLASLKHRFATSHPKKAALEGLEKMLFLMRRGLPQIVLPPHPRPYFPLLKKLGFEGKPEAMLQKAYQECPNIFFACFSSSFMWTANAATITPSSDNADGKVHITPANLSTLLHRSLEAPFTSRLLKLLFSDPNSFVHHPPLPASTADEGAANHTRFSSGVHFFVYGRTLSANRPLETRFYPRQTEEAQSSIIRLHGLEPSQIVFAEQSPEAINAGVFHNDVISTGNGNFFLYHEKAFVDTPATIKALATKAPLSFFEVKEKEISLVDAVKSYLFNSQWVSLPDNKSLFIAPIECEEIPPVKRFLTRFIEESKAELAVFSLRESMQNGGGPACLRLRAVLNEKELQKCHSKLVLTEALGADLRSWIETHYRDTLHPEDLLDPELLKETRKGLEKLLPILGLPPTLYEEYLWIS